MYRNKLAGHANYALIHPELKQSQISQFHMGVGRAGGCALRRRVKLSITARSLLRLAKGWGEIGSAQAPSGTSISVERCTGEHKKPQIIIIIIMQITIIIDCGEQGLGGELDSCSPQLRTESELSCAPEAPDPVPPSHTPASRLGTSEGRSG